MIKQTYENSFISKGEIQLLIVPLSDIRMFCNRFFTIHKVHVVHAGAIRQLLYGCTHVWEIIHSLKLVDYLPVHTHKPYNNLLFLNERYNFPKECFLIELFHSA